METKRVIFSTYSSVYSSVVLEKLLENDSIEVVAIINSTRVIHPKYGFIRGALKQLQLSGFRYSTYLFIVTDLFRWFQPFSSILKSATKLKLRKSIHSLAKQKSIPLLDTLDINDKESLEFIEQSKPDFLLAAHLNQLVKPVILDLPDIDCINIHPSILPSYKGVDPVFYALLNKETQVGTSLHRMSENFDSGEILSVRIFPISFEKNESENSSVYSYNCMLFESGAKQAIEWIKNPLVVDTDLDKTSDSMMTDNYDSWPNREKVKLFKQAGNQLISLSDFKNIQ